MTRVSITRKINVRDPSVRPAWRIGMAQWEWKELTGTAQFSGQKPAAGTLDNMSGAALRSRLEAWNCLCASGSSVYIAGSGGHADYAGNEAYGIDLSVESPAWTMLRTSTAQADVIYASPSLYYADGRPTSAHLYYTEWVVGNEIIRVRADAIWGSGNEGGPAVDAFSLVSNDWKRSGIDTLYPQSPATTLARAICKDPRDDTIYLVGNTHLHKRNPVTGAWTQLAAFPQNGSAFYYTGSTVDTTRNRVVFFGDGYRAAQLGGMFYDIVQNTFTEFSFSGSGAATLISQSGNAGWYLPGMDKYVAKHWSGKDCFVIDPVSWAVTTQATTGGATIQDAANGVFNRFLPVPDLGGIFYQPQHDFNAWFLATE